MINAAVFLLSLATLYFEVLCTRALGFVLGPHYGYAVIGLAMFGQSVAGSILAVWSWRPRARQRGQVLCALALGLAATALATFFASTLAQERINAAIESAAGSGGMTEVRGAIQQSLPAAATGLGLVAALPHFLFGFFMTLVLSTADPTRVARLYGWDLVGGAVGCTLSYLAMEHTSYAATILVVPVAAAAAAAILLTAPGRPGRRALGPFSLGVLLVALVVALPRWFEPRPQGNVLARDYSMEHRVTDRWHAWNSYSRIGAFQLDTREGERRGMVALGNGEGIAHLTPAGVPVEVAARHEPSRLALALGIPSDILVLFAGVGSDMVQIDALAGGRSRITGVELNRTMVERARAMPELDLETFFSQPHIRLRTEEARAFLEADPGRYDVILLAWSGATVAYYLGTMGQTSQYLYTREAVRSVLEHLKPGGLATFMNTNKVNLLAAVRSVLDGQRSSKAGEAVIVLFQAGSPEADWRGPWDENRLLIKPDGFSPSDVRAIVAVGRELGLEVAYAPGHPPHPEYRAYAAVLGQPDLGEALARLSSANDLRFDIVTDDRPFALSLFRSQNYLSLDFWKDVFSGSDGRRRHALLFEHGKSRNQIFAREIEVSRAFFVVLFVLATLLLVLGPVLLAGVPVSWKRGARTVAYFSALGIGFMLVEVAWMHKMGLLLGIPSLAIAVVLAALVFFSGVGSTLSGRLFARGIQPGWAVAMLVAYLAGSAGCSPSELGMGWPLPARCALVIGLLAPAGFLMGLLFPQGLARLAGRDPALVAWAWAVNGATGTLTAGLAPVLAQIAGFQAMIVAAALCYAALLLIPGFRLVSGPAHLGPDA